jgi:hypothetical protein
MYTSCLFNIQLVYVVSNMYFKKINREEKGNAGTYAQGKREAHA